MLLKAMSVSLTRGEDRRVPHIAEFVVDKLPHLSNPPLDNIAELGIVDVKILFDAGPGHTWVFLLILLMTG